MNGVNNTLVTEEIPKIKKELIFFFQSLMLSKVKFNDVQASIR